MRAKQVLCLLALGSRGLALPRRPNHELGDCTGGDYSCYAAQTATTLLSRYQDHDDGLFGSTLPWIEANGIESLCEWAIREGGPESPAVRPLWQNITYMLSRGSTVSQPQYPSDRSDDCGEPYCGSFDDQAWWGLAWAKAYELTGKPTHLWQAVRTFVYLREMSWDETQCGGRAWWSESHHYKNSITNQLYFSLAAQLHPLWVRYIDGDSSSGSVTQELQLPWHGPNVTKVVDKDYFIYWARKSWSWIESKPLRDPST